MHFCLSGQILPPNLHEIQPQVCMKCVQAGTETQEFTLSKCNIEKKTHTDLFLSGWENAWFSWRQSWFNPYQHVRCYKSWTNLTISISSLEELDKAFVCLGACSVVSFSLLEPIRFPCPWDFPGKKTEMGCHFLVQFHHLLVVWLCENCIISLCFSFFPIHKRYYYLPFKSSF